MFKERLLKCEPIDLGLFVMDLRERHLDYWISYSDMHPWERNSKCSTYHQRCALPTKRALVTRSPHILPRFMFLDLPRDVIVRSEARFRLRAHTLRIETVIWTHNSSPAWSTYSWWSGKARMCESLTFWLIYSWIFEVHSFL